MSYFDFKQFRIYHDRCAMKVGTDGVLLGAWAEIQHSRQILDIGTGSGLIAIMLAQRSHAQISGIEIDPDAAEQAMENARNCPFSARLNICQCDLNHYEPANGQRFDNIVSNPPFYQESILPPDSTRATARHTQGLTLNVLVAQAKRLMLPDALFQVVLPYSATNDFLSICALHELSLLHRTDVCTKEGKPFKRSLICMTNNIAATQPIRDTLCLSDGGNGRSAAYTELTKDFYIR